MTSVGTCPPGRARPAHMPTRRVPGRGETALNGTTETYAPCVFLLKRGPCEDGGSVDRESGEDSEVRCTTGSEKTWPPMMVMGAGAGVWHHQRPDSRACWHRTEASRLISVENREQVSHASGATQPLSWRPKSVVDFRKQTQIISRNQPVWLFQ